MIWNRINGRESIKDENREESAAFSTEENTHKLTNRPPAPKSDQLISLEGKSKNEIFEENPRLDRYVAILERGLSIDQLKNTQALKISFNHTDPKTTVLVANALAQAFIEYNFQLKTEKFSKASGWLADSTKKLEENLEKAEKELADYLHDNNMISTTGQNSLTSVKLTRLHDEAMKAEMDLMLKKSLYEEVKLGHTDQLPVIYTDARLGDLQRRLNDVSQTLARLSVDFGPENYQVREAVQQKHNLEDQIGRIRSGIEERLKIEYEKAMRDRQTVQSAMDNAKSDAVEQDQAAIRLNILRQRADTARTLYNEFLLKNKQIDLDRAQQQNNISLLQPARLPKSSTGTPISLAVSMAFAFGLVGASGLAFLLERFDRTIKNIADVNRYVQLPTIGVIPAARRPKQRKLYARSKVDKARPLSLSKESLPSSTKEALGGAKNNVTFSNGNLPVDEGVEITETSIDGIAMLNQQSAVAEAYRVLRTSVLLANGENPPKTLLITSSEPSEGKTTTTINTAISLAQLGASVLIIDADLRKPSAHKGLGVNRTHGLSTCLMNDVEPSKVIQKLNIPNLYFLPSGPIPSNPAELLISQKMKKLINLAEQRFDHIIIDSSPLMYVTDPVILSTMVNGVILVVRGGKIKREVVSQAREMLTSVGAKIYGVVLNDIDLRHSSYDFAYYRYYAEYGKEREEESASDLLA
jgi:capsular exopolysaccharide synthesis family protein